ncbi:MAG: hypothetical protein ABI462_01415 [Ignavibacteria bacterium]
MDNKNFTKIKFNLNKLFLIPAVLFNFYAGCTDNSIDQPSPPVAEYTQIDFEPAWNTSGNKIAYAHSNIDNDLSGIYVTSSSGLSSTQLVTNFARSPEWSPDGTQILYSQFFQIYKINTAGDSAVQLTNGGENYYPKWSSDGSLIAFSRYEGSAYNIFTMNSDGKQITEIDDNANFPEWENNSNSILYFKPFYNKDHLQKGDTLFQYILNSGAKNLLTILNGDVHNVNMYPVYTGDEIVFSSLDKDGYSYIYKMQHDGSNIVKLTDTQGYSPAYSFAAQKIIYTNRNKGNGRLWTMDKNGNNKTQLTH